MISQELAPAAHKGVIAMFAPGLDGEVLDISVLTRLAAIATPRLVALQRAPARAA